MLEESQFSLGGVVFGRGTDIEVSVFEEGEISSTYNDMNNPISDGVSFGYDFHQGRILTFEMWSNRRSASEASQTVAELSRAWNDPSHRNRPRNVSELRVRAWGSPERIVYGRPRKFSAPNNTLIRQGVIHCLGEFHTVDGNYYDADPKSIHLSLITQGEEGGIVWPIEWPITWSGTYQRQDGINIHSPLGAYPIITFFGPVATPTLEYVGTNIRIRFNGQLAFDQSVTIDTRPWVRTVKLNNGSNQVGKLMGSRMADLHLPAGQNTFRYTGGDMTAQSTCRIQWQDSHTMY